MKRRWLAPEVIQTSAMDCGPAALKCLLDGHGIAASYGRLREACQTGVDGTSIDALEEAAVQMGLEAEQVMVPVDHVLAEGSDLLPAMVIVRQPGGLTHFVVAWRRYGGWLQVMDPAVGRQWVRVSSFLEHVYRHSQKVPAEAWLEWARGESFLKVLRGRMKGIGAWREGLAEGTEDLGRLDAAVRMAEALVGCGAMGKGATAGKLVEKLATSSMRPAKQYWSAEPVDEETLTMHGAVLLTVKGAKAASESPMRAELAAALGEKPVSALRELWKMMLGGGMLAPGVILFALLGEALGAGLEALLFRGMLDIGRELAISGQRLGALGALLALTMIMLGMEYFVAGGVRGLGRRLEAEVRVRFLSKLPRLSDRYFQSRPISDMASRSHQLQQLREAPQLGAALVKAVMEMAVTAAGIAWLYPEMAWAGVLLGLVSAGIPLAAQPGLAERDMRMRSHAGALTQFYLDALQGLTAIRSHGAGRAMRRAQESLLAAWAEAGLSVQRMTVVVEGLQMAVTYGLAAWIIWGKLFAGGQVGGVLLLVYWVMQMPALGREVAGVAWQYPSQRNTTLRILEPLGAPEEARGSAASGARRTGGVEIALEDVTVRAGGHLILDGIDLRIAAGEHVAVVGASGAGKSSLVGLFLGWHKAESGSVKVDGEELAGDRLAGLREETAWVDPQVQLWNRSLFSNLRYGVEEGGEAGMNRILDEAQLAGLLEKLPEGYQTVLGEGGALVSGGEGQRVRAGRGMGRGEARLAILDEPARGLSREARRKILEAARRRWAGATLVGITHDIGDTFGFARVVVIDGGRVAEDGAPAELAARGGVFARLLEAEAGTSEETWADGRWRRWTIAEGRVVERGGAA